MDLSEVVRACFLGVVQGITEFLPISSDGHLAIFGKLLPGGAHSGGHAGGTMELVLALHVGTLLSIIVVFWNDLWELPKRPLLCAWIILGTIPAAIVGLLFKDAFEATFESPVVAGVGFLVTAAALFLGQYWERPEQMQTEVRWWQAAFIGCCQVFALFPGISRSGTTISAGLASGLERSASTRFSFLLAVPVIGGATLLMVKDVIEQGSSQNSLVALISGAITAGIVGYLSLKWLLRIVTQRRLHWFAWYCTALGVLVITQQCFSSPTPDSPHLATHQQSPVDTK